MMTSTPRMAAYVRMGGRERGGCDLISSLCPASTALKRSPCGYACTMNDRNKLSTAQSQQEGHAAGDDALEDDLTQARQVTPQKKEDVAEDLNMDP